MTNSVNDLQLNYKILYQISLDYLKDCALQSTQGNSSKGLKGEHLRIENYEIRAISEQPKGFLANHHYLVVRMLQDFYEFLPQELQGQFFVKSAPVQIPSRMKYAEEFGIYAKELQIYSTVMPKLTLYSNDLAAKCFYASDNVIILEDLTTLGYRCAAERDGLLDLQHLRCAVSKLADMHAASLIYEQDLKQKINEIHTSAVAENAYPLNVTSGHVRQKNFSNAVKVLQEIVKYLPQYQKHLEIITKQIPLEMSRIFTMAQASEKYRNVFSHGDLWANNIMFAYQNLDQTKPLSCRFVDFQLARYAPPILDLITLVTIPSDRNFRQQHLPTLIDFYYDELQQRLRNRHLNINDFICKEEYYKSYEEFRICGLIESLLFSHLTLLPMEFSCELMASDDGFSNFFEHKRVEICLKAFETDEIYCKRMTDILEDFLDNFLLKDSIITGD